ncbi:hypothetical protein BLNAU_10744 [Blattamonas nauphoetae]|uniref:Uncharacterized protein n=1 Tax=Blattamonas nauphoetae TaxID=2049346 RepID=A0ABQ9XRF6_9EUKA|nr:hypothetical protein BLNAU_10744 [Blattamonas nauphoetae]
MSAVSIVILLGFVFVRSAFAAILKTEVSNPLTGLVPYLISPESTERIQDEDGDHLGRGRGGDLFSQWNRTRLDLEMNSSSLILGCHSEKNRQPLLPPVSIALFLDAPDLIQELLSTPHFPLPILHQIRGKRTLKDATETKLNDYTAQITSGRGDFLVRPVGPNHVPIPLLNDPTPPSESRKCIHL